MCTGPVLTGMITHCRYWNRVGLLAGSLAGMYWGMLARNFRLPAVHRRLLAVLTTTFGKYKYLSEFRPVLGKAHSLVAGKWLTGWCRKVLDGYWLMPTCYLGWISASSLPVDAERYRGRHITAPRPHSKVLTDA